MTGNLVIDFDDDDVSLGLAGGKGLNLAKLSKSKFQVPPGFIITTNFYRKIVEEHNIEDFIKERLQSTSSNEFKELEQISKSIRAKFESLIIKEDLFAPIKKAYERIGSSNVSVRSSATAEDLEDLSFAGQHDTILNVLGIESLKKAILTCLGSLWTSRAIGYRQQNHIPHDNLSLAVIVQTMVQSEISGVLFTVNPLTGNRNEYVIDSTFGLGEALVSGMIEPDHYVMNALNGKIINKTIGSKKKSIVSVNGGGIKEEKLDNKSNETLSKKDLTQLVKLGQEVSSFYGYPQDIEWAFVQNNLYLLQSRPVTTLFPVSDQFLDGPKRTTFSFAAVQGFLDPMTPLGRDTIKTVLLNISRPMGYRLDFNTQTVFWEMAERLWININYPLKNRIIKNRFMQVIGGIDAGFPRILNNLDEENWLTTGKKPNFKAGRIITRLILAMMLNVRKFISDPKNSRIASQKLVDEAIQRVLTNSKKELSLERKIKYYFQVLEQLGALIFLPVGPAIGAGYIPLIIANKLSKDVLGESNTILEFTRSLPNNPTTEMNLELAKVAKFIKNDKALQKLFDSNSAETLSSSYLSGTLPSTIQELIKDFLDKFGMRGFVEIDIGRKRWSEDPLHVMNTIKSYINLPDQQDPITQNKKGINSAYESYNKLLKAVKNSKGGLLKSRILSGGFIRTRELAGLREYPKFSIIRIFWILKNMMLQVGEELEKQGVIGSKEDVFYLTYKELTSLKNLENESLIEIVKLRKEKYKQEKSRKSLPRIILSDGRTFYDVPSKVDLSDKNILIGSPVSPGVIKARVRIVDNPSNSTLQPGEILVCTATDPSWTPLFLIASGLIMEVGGLMQHGSVVAREHNIPAIVGVNDVTNKLKDGQFVSMNGSTGVIKILDP